MKIFSFGKKEHLKKRDSIQSLFTKSHSLFLFPIKIQWVITEAENNEAPIQILVTASKRRIKKAYQRNKIKRLLRESYRKNKYIIHDSFCIPNKHLIIAISYIGENIPQYNEIEPKIIILLQRLIKKYNNIDHK